MKTLNEMPAWKFMVMVVFSIFVLSMIFTLIEDGFLTEDNFTTISRDLMFIVGGGVGTSVVAAKMRKSSNKWNGTERRKGKGRGSKDSTSE